MYIYIPKILIAAIGLIILNLYANSAEASHHIKDRVPLPYQQEAFDKLLAVAGPKAADLKLEIDWNNSDKGSYYRNSTRTVTISIGDIAMSPDKEGWIFVMGHEIAHALWNYRDRYSNRACYKDNKAHRGCETMADIIGQELMQKAGYDHCKANSLVKEWYRMYGDFNHADPSHPYLSRRIKYLTCKE